MRSPTMSSSPTRWRAAAAAHTLPLGSIPCSSPTRSTPTRYTPTRFMPTRCTPTRCMPTRSTPIRRTRTDPRAARRVLRISRGGTRRAQRRSQRRRPEAASPLPTESPQVVVLDTGLADDRLPDFCSSRDDVKRSGRRLRSDGGLERRQLARSGRRARHVHRRDHRTHRSGLRGRDSHGPRAAGRRDRVGDRRRDRRHRASRTKPARLLEPVVRGIRVGAGTVAQRGGAARSAARHRGRRIGGQRQHVPSVVSPPRSPASSRLGRSARTDLRGSPTTGTGFGRALPGSGCGQLRSSPRSTDGRSPSGWRATSTASDHGRPGAARRSPRRPWSARSRARCACRSARRSEAVERLIDAPWLGRIPGLGTVVNA